MTLTGKLDFDGDTARIEGDSQASRKMLPAAAKWCTDRLKKGMIVDCELVPDGDKHGWISKIYEHKLEGPACTSPAAPVNNTPAKPANDDKYTLSFVEQTAPVNNTPAKPANDGLPKTVEGQIVFIDHPAHKITVKDKTGKTHDFVWPATAKMANNKGEPLKQWWFVKVTGEPSGDLWKLTDHTYFKRPDDWPFAKGASGGGGQPRNERLIVFQNMHTAALNGAQHATTPDGQDYDDFMDMVYARAKKDTEQAMKDFGGA